MTNNTASINQKETELFAQLSELGIKTRTEEHAAVFTVEDSAAIKQNMPGGHTKNLFLKDKAGQFVLICAVNDTEIKVNKLHAHIGCKRLSFGKAEALEEKLGVKPGSVTLFSIINDVAGDVKLVLDSRLMDHETVWFHPLRNTASTAISSADIMVFAEATGHSPQIIDFAGLLEEKNS